MIELGMGLPGTLTNTKSKYCNELSIIVPLIFELKQNEN